MTLQQLRAAAAIADAGSFSRAAERLFLSQPSLTGAIHELEAELGFALFNRTSRGVTLTADGLAFMPYARSVLTQYEELIDTFGRAGKRRQRFAVSTQHYSFAVKAFVELTRGLDVAMYDFALRETRTRQVIDDVAAGRSEIGILYLSEFNRRALSKLMADSGVLFHRLIDCSAYVYLWKGHPLAGRKAITFEELAPYPNLSFEQGDDSNFYLAEEILSTNQYARTIRCSDRATMLNLMVGVNGYTLCSGIICEELNGSDYAAVPYAADEENPNSRMEIGWLTRKDNLPGEMGKRYVEELKRYLGVEEKQ